jgi:hypothetical protein
MRTIYCVLFVCLTIMFCSSSRADASAHKLRPTASGCSTNYFSLYELRAKDEVLRYRGGIIYYGRLVSFLLFLHEEKRDADQFCGYTSDHYLAMLWLVTKTLKQRLEAKGSRFSHDSYDSSAEYSLNRLWIESIERGWNRVPKNPLRAKCIKSDVLLRLERCEKLEPAFFSEIRKLKLPKGWKLAK